MGTDIHGWVEYWDPDTERLVATIRLVPLLSDRNYEIFAWLFGVRRRPGIPMRWIFPPIAAGRGLPPDASPEVVNDYASCVAQYPEEFYGASWITWREVQALDWDAPIEDRILETRQGQPPGTGIVHWRSHFLAEHADLLPSPADALRPGQQWTVNTITYTVQATRCRDMLEDGWELLFQMLEMLASRCGESSHVRMAVWFDG